MTPSVSSSALVPQVPETVVVLRLTALGDVVLTTPALEALKTAWPLARIVVATRPAFVPLVAHHPAVHAVVPVPPGLSLRDTAATLRGFAPTALLDLHGKFQARALAVMLGVSRHVTWHKRPLLDTVLVKLRLRPYHAKKHISARYHDAVEALVGQPVPRGRLALHLAQQDVVTADRVLQDAGVTATQPLLGMSPGANWATKRWPLERYTQLAVHAVEHLGARVVLTGSVDEQPLLDTVAAAVPNAVNLGGKLSLGVLGAVVSRCRVFVANDSGPMHMARALGVPTLTFFGSTDPRQFDFTPHAALWANRDCAPCSLYGLNSCPRGHFGCMLDLDVARAANELTRLWNGARGLLVAG